MDKTLVDSTIRQSENMGKSSDATLLEGSIASSPLLSPSTLFRGWTLLEQLPTRGSEADIYLVQAEGTQSILKLYRHRMEPKLEVLSRIAEISRRYSHCFVIFKDAGFDEQTGRWFELQEYFPLGSLKEVDLNTKGSPSFVRSLVSELSNAIDCLHCNDIVHCDIKPGNVLIRSLEPLDAVLTDFGISSLLASDLSRKMTSLKGTPMYWAPEAFSRMVGRTSDWWGLGMIVLELLAGAHPFEGLTDSQIIHKLTLGDVEIPNTLEADFRLLLRGLLTKDDTQRWGRPQVSRWLAGDRDIPVAAAPVPTEVISSSSLPFSFEGKEYLTPEALALAFCEHEKPWHAAISYLRYVRQWFESRMRFSEAQDIGNWLGAMEPERALFRFIYTYARCPFSYMGKLIDPDNLRLFVGRTVRLEEVKSEGEIVAMLGDGRLLALYTEYELLTGYTADPFLLRILEVTSNIPPERQWVCFDAMENPRNYIWPKDFHPNPNEKLTTLEVLAHLKILLFSRTVFSELNLNYVLPNELTALLNKEITYAKGAAALRNLQNQGLLVPLSADSKEESYAVLSLEEYVRKANAICKGRTPELLSRLDFLIENIKKQSSMNECDKEILSLALVYFEGLREQSINEYNTQNINKLTELFRNREEFFEKFSARILLSGILVGLLSLFIHIHSLSGSLITIGCLIESQKLSNLFQKNNSSLVFLLLGFLFLSNLLLGEIFITGIILGFLGFGIFAVFLLYLNYQKVLSLCSSFINFSNFTTTKG